jgi:hypothetical protein
MKITLSREEVEKIILDYANKVVEGYGFNEVVSRTYYDLQSVEIVKSEPKELIQPIQVQE